jgi:diaminopimelate epimerase
MKIAFQKFEGAGNDFVIIDNRTGVLRNRGRLARALCDRHRSIGGDGLLLVERTDRAAYRMMYYNADGSDGGMCGNGGRCVAMYAYLNGIAGRSHQFEALRHIYTASVISSSRVRLWMKDPVGYRGPIRLSGKVHSFIADFIDTGSPHAVIEVRKGRLKALDLASLGPWIRHHRAFRPFGVNVNFIERTGSNILKMRTYERGVEAETLACGTGSVACSIVSSLRQGMRSPVTVVAASGDRLRVSFNRTASGFRDVVLEGPAVRTFSGTVHV